MDANTIKGIVLDYSSLTRILIGLGLDAVKGLKALFALHKTPLTEAEQDQILTAVFADAGVREALARADAGLPEATD